MGEKFLTERIKEDVKKNLEKIKKFPAHQFDSESSTNIALHYIREEYPGLWQKIRDIVPKETYEKNQGRNIEKTLNFLFEAYTACLILKKDNNIRMNSKVPYDCVLDEE